MVIFGISYVLSKNVHLPDELRRDVRVHYWLDLLQFYQDLDTGHRAFIATSTQSWYRYGSVRYARVR